MDFSNNHTVASDLLLIISKLYHTVKFSKSAHDAASHCSLWLTTVRQYCCIQFVESAVIEYFFTCLRVVYVDGSAWIICFWIWNWRDFSLLVYIERYASVDCLALIIRAMHVWCMYAQWIYTYMYIHISVCMCMKDN